MIPQLNDLLFFSQIVQSGSFTAAAKALGVPKSLISRRLNKLEQALECQLMLRTTRSIALTEIGKVLYQQCKPHLNSLATIDEEVFSLLNTPKGTLKILLPLEFFNQLMTELVVEFAQHYPKVDLCCSHYAGFFPTQIAEFDLAFVLHESSLPASDWIARPLMSFPQSIYASCKFNAKNISHPKDIQHAPCIVSSDEAAWHFRHNNSVESVTINGKISLASPEMQLHAVNANLGIAKLPDYTTHRLIKTGCLQRIPLNFAPMAQELSVLYPSRSMPAKSRAFLDFFQTKLGLFSDR